MKILDYERYTGINESVRSELFKNGMCVMYSADGEHKNYLRYLCLTDKKDIKTAVEKLTWPTGFNDSDRTDILNDRYGIMIASMENGAVYVLISDVIVNNIIYIWDTKLKLKDCMKDGVMKDLEDKCDTDNLIYEKDVDFTQLSNLGLDYPYYNYGLQPTDWSSLSRGYDAWALDHIPNRPGSFSQPGALYI